MDLSYYKLEDLKRVQKEMFIHSSNIQTLLRIQYAATVTILMYSLTHQNPLMTILPFFVIMPIYSISNGHDKSICRNAAYIIVFYGQEIAPEWELRLLNYRKDRPHEKGLIRNSSVRAYALEFLAICVAFCITSFQYLKKINALPNLNQAVPFEFIMCIVGAVITILICIRATLWISHSKVNYLVEIEKCIEKWNKVKKEEKLDRVGHLNEIKECVDIWKKIKDAEKLDNLPVSL